MSVTATSRIFWTKIDNLPYVDKNGKQVTVSGATCKLVLLAIGDVADDFGENSYQSFDTLASKSSIERRSVMRAVRALITNGFLRVEGLSRYGTNNYSIPLDKLGSPPEKRAKNGRPKTSDPDAISGDFGAESGDCSAESDDLPSPDTSVKHPENIHKTSSAPKEPPPPLKANQIPEIILYKHTTGQYPPKPMFFTVLDAVEKVRKRLGREPTADDLRPFYEAWCKPGWNPRAVTWLTDYAATGRMPQANRARRDSNADFFAKLEANREKEPIDVNPQ